MQAPDRGRILSLDLGLTLPEHLIAVKAVQSRRLCHGADHLFVAIIDYSQYCPFKTI